MTIAGYFDSGSEPAPYVEARVHLPRLGLSGTVSPASPATRAPYAVALPGGTLIGVGAFLVDALRRSLSRSWEGCRTSGK